MVFDYFSSLSKAFSKQLVKMPNICKIGKSFFIIIWLNTSADFKYYNLKKNKIKLIARKRLRIIYYHSFHKTLRSCEDKPIFVRKTINLPNFTYFFLKNIILCILLNKKSSFVYFLERLASSRHFEKLIFPWMPIYDFTENSRHFLEKLCMRREIGWMFCMLKIC